MGVCCATRQTNGTRHQHINIKREEGTCPKRKNKHTGAIKPKKNIEQALGKDPPPK